MIKQYNKQLDFSSCNSSQTLWRLPTVPAPPWSKSPRNKDSKSSVTNDEDSTHFKMQKRITHVCIYCM